MNSDIIRKKIGQLLVFGFKGQTADPEIKELIREYHVGGVILFARNIGSAQQVLELTSELQRTAREAGYQRPLLICADQENGVVRRLGIGTTVFPGAMLLGATGRPENAYAAGKATGTELKALGINWNLAPVVDVNNNPRNPVIGVRSYSEDPHTVTAFAREAIRGMREAGVITTLKHFPGHGDTVTDSHLDLPVIRHGMERMERVELAPYRQLIPDWADTIMTAHIRFPAIDGEDCPPATLSHSIITGLLRTRLGFRGVVTTDCMEMKAIQNSVGTAKGAVLAIKAGVDMVMVSHTYELQKEAAELLLRAVLNRDVEEEVLASAEERIQALKDRYLSWNDIPTGSGMVLRPPETVGSLQHKLLAREIYKQGVTLYKNEQRLVPVSCSPGWKVLVIHPGGRNIVQVEDMEYSGCSLGEAVREVFPGAEAMEFSDSPGQEEREIILDKASGYDLVIAGTMSAVQDPEQIQLVNGLLKRHPRVILIAMKSPYDLACFPEARTYVATYEYTYPALVTAARLVFGQEKPMGKMPVTIGQATESTEGAERTEKAQGGVNTGRPSGTKC